MDLEFKTKKLQKQCEDFRIAQKDYGLNICKKLTQRVNELRAADSLDDIAKNSLANGFHELDGIRNGEYAVTLVHPYRLVFKASDLVSSEEKMEYSDIKLIRIEEVVDYHGKIKRK